MDTANNLVLIMPTYTMFPELGNMAYQNLKSWVDHVDFAIVTEDNGQPYLELMREADLYLYHDNLGAASNMVLAWHVALALGAEYVLITDSDVRLLEGDLNKMCIPDKVTVPLIKEYPDTQFTAPTLCVPRSVSTKYGMYDTSRRRDDGFDAEYAKKINHLVVKVPSVVVTHVGRATRSNL